MIRITISTPDARKQSIENDSQTVREILEKHNINPGASSLILDGIILSSEQQRTSLKDLGVSGDATLAVCVKLANA